MWHQVRFIIKIHQAQIARLQTAKLCVYRRWGNNQQQGKKNIPPGDNIHSMRAFMIISVTTAVYAQRTSANTVTAVGDRKDTHLLCESKTQTVSEEEKLPAEFIQGRIKICTPVGIPLKSNGGTYRTSILPLIHFTNQTATSLSGCSRNLVVCIHRFRQRSALICIKRRKN